MLHATFCPIQASIWKFGVISLSTLIPQIQTCQLTTYLIVYVGRRQVAEAHIKRPGEELAISLGLLILNFRLSLGWFY